MPVVPYGPPRVEERPLPGVRVNTQVPLEAFGGGQGLERVTGQARGLLGDALKIREEEQTRADDIAFIELDTELQNEETARKVAVEKIKGKQAQAATTESLSAFDKAYKAVSERAGNDRIREKLNRTYLLRRSGLDQHHQVYAAKETRSYVLSTLKASQQSIDDSVAADPSPENLSDALAKSEQNIDRMRIYEGWSDEEAKGYNLAASSNLRTIILHDKLLKRDYAGAKQLYDEWSKAATKDNPVFTTADKQDLDKAMRDGVERMTAQDVVDKIRSENVTEEIVPPTPDYGLREDKTQKGGGFLGEVRELRKLRREGENPYTGRVMTEASVEVEVDGKKMLIPTLVPGLNDRQITWIAEGNDPMVVKEMRDIIIAHAMKRVQDGKSPFAGPEETPAPAGRKVERKPNLGEAMTKLEADTTLDPESKRLARSYLIEAYRQDEVVAGAVEDANYKAAKAQMQYGVDPKRAVDPLTLSKLSPEDLKRLTEVFRDPVNNDGVFGRFMNLTPDQIRQMSESDIDGYLRFMDSGRRAQALDYVVKARKDQAGAKAVQGMLSDQQMLKASLAGVPGTGFDTTSVGREKMDDKQAETYGKLLAEANAVMLVLSEQQGGGVVDDKKKKQVFDALVLRHYQTLKIRQTAMWLDWLNPDDTVTLDELESEDIKNAYKPIEDVSAADITRITEGLVGDGLTATTEKIEQIRAQEIVTGKLAYEKKR